MKPQSQSGFVLDRVLLSWCGVASACIRTDSRRLNHVADGEPLDGLVLGSASRAVGAPDGLDVAAACEEYS